MNVPKKKKKKKTFLSKLLKIAAILLALCFLAAVGVGLLAAKEIAGPGEDGSTILITIPDGASTGTIGAVLKENGLIGSDLLFKIYSRLKGQDGTYQCGDHQMKCGASYDELIYELQQTTYEDIETFSVTFSEGTTCLAMALKFESMGICSVDEFLDECNYGTFETSFMDKISDDEDKFVKIEGFLFPDTYEFPLDFTVHDIIQKMLTTFEEKVYTEDFRRKVEESDLSLEENIILASIVEKETFGDQYYPMVAGVFVNRLADIDTFPRMETDVSAECMPGNFIYGVLGYYYNGDAEGYVRNIPWNMIEAYDTYTKRGLPVGAICNPGLKALQGTVDYDHHDYYFFVNDVDKNYYWATNAWDHERNVEEVQEYNRTHG